MIGALVVHLWISDNAHPRSEPLTDWSSKITSLIFGSRIKLDICAGSCRITAHSDPAARSTSSINWLSWESTASAGKAESGFAPCAECFRAISAPSALGNRVQGRLIDTYSLALRA